MKPPQGPRSGFLRIEKLLQFSALKNYYSISRLEPSRSSSGYCSGCFKPLLDPDGGFRIETAVRVLHGRFGSETEKYLTAMYFRTSPNGRKCPFGCNGHVTAVVVGQSQRLYSGVSTLTGNYLSFL
jgi:hypothetical protein